MNIKKIIAREGLVVLTLLLITFFGGNAWHLLLWNRTKEINSKNFIVSDLNTFTPYPTLIEVWTFFSLIAIIAYIIYLLIRFIIWAVKTLKSK